MPIFHFGDSSRMMVNFDTGITVLISENLHWLHLASLTEQLPVLSHELGLLRA